MRQPSEFSSREAVLGLVIEQPDNSYRLGQRLDRKLPAARYVRGTAEKAVKSLAADGLIRPARAQSKHGAGVPYEATADGVAHFRGWLRASTSIPPVREELHAKIALCGPDDLPLMIASVREIERACVSELQAANKRMQSERLAAGEAEWRRRMGIVVSAGDAAWWDGRIKWLQKVRLYLEEELKSDQAGKASIRGK